MIVPTMEQAERFCKAVHARWSDTDCIDIYPLVRLPYYYRQNGWAESYPDLSKGVVVYCYTAVGKGFYLRVCDWDEFTKKIEDPESLIEQFPFSGR